jgi:hypothetical protein
MSIPIAMAISRKTKYRNRLALYEIAADEAQVVAPVIEACPIKRGVTFYRASISPRNVALKIRLTEPSKRAVMGNRENIRSFEDEINHVLLVEHSEEQGGREFPPRRRNRDPGARVRIGAGFRGKGVYNRQTRTLHKNMANSAKQREISPLGHNRNATACEFMAHACFRRVFPLLESRST